MNQLYLPFLIASSKPKSKKTRLRETNHPQFCLIETWAKLVLKFFPERSDLYEYSIKWSNRRQKRTLATCNIKLKRVKVAKELKNPEHWHILEALIYHEMCHAVLGFSIKKTVGKTPWHGKEFKQLEARHPGIAQLNSWIKQGGWRRAVRQDRSKYPSRKRQSTKKLFTRFISTHLSRIFVRMSRAK